MDKKRIRVKTENVEDMTIKYTRFGWQVVNTTENGDKVEIELERDNTIPNYKNIKKMEKQYWSLKRVFPTGLVVWFVLGTACLIVRLTTSFPYNDLLWFGMALCYCLAFYHLFLFVVISINRRKLVDALKNFSQTTLGMTSELPYEVNIESINENTGLIDKYYRKGKN